MVASKNNIVEPFNIQLIAVDLVGLSLPVRYEGFADGMTFNFNMIAEERVYLEQNAILMTLHIKVSDSPEHKENLGEISVACTFKAEQDLSKYRDSETNEFSIPQAARITMHSLSISTARGYMASEFRGTALRPAVLPIVDPKSFLAAK